MSAQHAACRFDLITSESRAGGRTGPQWKPARTDKWPISGFPGRTSTLFASSTAARAKRATRAQWSADCPPSFRLPTTM